jgi:V8-like Glu-specific endopeptidase
MKKPLLLILLLCLNCLAHAQVILATKTIDSAHNAVVALMRLDSNGKILTRATGVLIHPRVILTAGHVNYKRYPDGIDRRGFVAPTNTALQTKTYIPFDWIDNVLMHPDFKKLTNNGKNTPLDLSSVPDIGLIFLDNPIENMPIAKLPQPQLFLSLPAQTAFLGVGYGYHKIRDSTFKYPLIDGIRRKWKPQAVSVVNDLWIETMPDSISKQPFTNVADSGAPLLLNDRIIIGITSGGRPVPNSSGFTRIDNPEVINWIKAEVKKKLGVDL